MCNPVIEYGKRHRGIMAPPQDRDRICKLRERACRQIVDLDSYIRVSASLRREGLELEEQQNEHSD